VAAEGLEGYGMEWMRQKLENKQGAAQCVEVLGIPTRDVQCWTTLGLPRRDHLGMPPMEHLLLEFMDLDAR
jgi:hypothetical protein